MSDAVRATVQWGNTAQDAAMRSGRECWNDACRAVQGLGAYMSGGALGEGLRRAE